MSRPASMKDKICSGWGIVLMISPPITDATVTSITRAVWIFGALYSGYSVIERHLGHSIPYVDHCQDKSH